jgi:murein DD-endopeptidase
MSKASGQILAIIFLGLTGAGCAPWPERPEAQPYTTVQASRTAEILRLAQQELGRPYVYGGATPRGFDCSGLVYYIFRRAGIAVPRTANAQLYASHPVNLQQLRPGDLVFFEIAGNIQMHVGIYVGNGEFIHAPETGQPVSYAFLDSPYWKTRFVDGGRF